MGVEIERKFLVVGHEWQTDSGVMYCQGYLNRDRNRTVRVRIAGAKAYLTIKGSPEGLARAEFEYEIPVDDAVQMLKLCDGPLVEKIRHKINHHGMVWEVDEFLGANLGLVVAEIELDAPDQEFARPDWLGEEVSSDLRYFNSNLAMKPYSTWDSSAAT
jgi:CYTH domain-containing protein